MESSSKAAQSTPVLSACVIVKNGEKTIERCLRSLEFADEIIVIDAQSTDRTVEIARKITSKVVSHPWQGFATQRNIALNHSSGRWVFFLDADEKAEPNLGKILKQIAQEDPDKHPNCYSVKRVEFFLGKQLNYGPGNPSFQWRFFKKSGVRFEGEVHEFPRFEGGIGLIQSTGIAHWPDLSVEHFLTKMNHYTTLEAVDRFTQGQRTSLWHAFGTFFSTFFKNGIRYRGFLNGKEGLVLITLESFSRVVRHLKLWLYWQVHDGKIQINLNAPLPKPGSTKAPGSEDLDRGITGPVY